MPWVRHSDDDIEDLRTTSAARHLGPNGLGRVIAILTEARCYANRNLTDGRIDLLSAKRFRCDRRPLDVLQVMSEPLPTGEPGWLERDGDGWRIVGHTALNPTRARVLERRAADAARQRKFRDAAARKQTELEDLLQVLVRQAYDRLPPRDRAAVAAGERASLLEDIKGLAARAAIPYSSASVGRALDVVVQRAAR